MSGRRGVLIVVALLTLVGAGVLTVAMSLRRPVAQGGGASVLVFDVPSDLDEAPSLFGPFSLSGFRPGRLQVHDVVRAIRHAAVDDHVEALVLHIDGVDWGWARLAEVRDAVLAFRATGKPVVASLAGGGEREYLLASAARTVCTPPTAQLQLDGLALSATFFRGSLDKLGVTPNFAQVGTFKSGTESYTRTSFSAPAREALDALLDDQYALLCDSIGAVRGLDPDTVRAIFDEGPFTATEALAHGLVDTLLYDTDADSLAMRVGSRRLPAITLARYLDRMPAPRGSDHIALVVASGTIAPGKSREDPMDGRVLGSETLIQALREVRTRRAVKAIVLRIDSPGGSAQASDDIWREVVRCSEAKPVIVSMSDAAASGGYYIAMGGDLIIAEPSTLTGSIGIYGGKLNVEGLYRKLGMSVETLGRGRHATMMSGFHDFTDEERAVFERHLREFYLGFLDRVASNREMTRAQVDSVAQGRVWSGLAAYDLGLVDGLGGLDEAFSSARERAHIAEDAEVVTDVYPRVEHPFLSRMLEDWLQDDERGAETRVRLPEVMRAWLVAASFPAGAPLALMPWSIEIR
jgi:protease-4